MIGRGEARPDLVALDSDAGSARNGAMSENRGRTLEISADLAQRLSRARAVRGDTTPCRLRIEDIDAVEDEIDCRVPDAVLAYIAAGVSAWGDGPLSVLRVRDLTLEVREMAEQTGDPAIERMLSRVVVFDDDANGNYLAFPKGAARTSEQIYFVEHEACTLIDASLASQLDRVVARGNTSPSPTVALVFEMVGPDPEPPTAWAVHPRFGRGRVVSRMGDTLVIQFENDGEKRLKASFVTIEE